MMDAALGGVRFFDLTGRGSLVLTGRDRATFLHGLVTNDIKRLSPGQGCAAAFLTPKGKMLAECVVLCEPDRLVVDTPPELADTVEALLRKYLVFNDVTIGNETAEMAVLHLVHIGDQGTDEGFLRKCMGLARAELCSGAAHAHAPARLVEGAAPPTLFTFEEKTPSLSAPPAAGNDGTIPVCIVSENRTGIPGFDLRIPSPRAAGVSAALRAAGARPAPAAELDALRIEAGIPRWGAELGDSVLPDEAGLRERGFIAENKGCYVGQETVARIKTYGHVNRRLVGLLLPANAQPAPGAPVSRGGVRVGAITSSVFSERLGKTVALAYVGRDHAAPGTSLDVSAAAGSVVEGAVASFPLAG